MNTVNDEPEEIQHTFLLPEELKKKLIAFVDEIFPPAKAKILHAKFRDGIEKNDPRVIYEIARAVGRSSDYGIHKIPGEQEKLGVLQKELKEWLVKATQ